MNGSNRQEVLRIAGEQIDADIESITLLDGKTPKELDGNISLYGCGNLSLPVQSLTNLVHFSLEVSIGEYLLLINCARIMLFAILSVLILKISNYCKKTIASIMMSAAMLGSALLVLYAI